MDSQVSDIEQGGYTANNGEGGDGLEICQKFFGRVLMRPGVSQMMYREWSTWIGDGW